MKPTNIASIPKSALLQQLAAYLLVGIAAAGLYGVGAWALFTTTTLPVFIVSIFGILCASPVAYLGHKYLTFRSGGGHRQEAPRFVVSLILGLAVSSISLEMTVNMFKMTKVTGVALTSIITPVVNFLILRFWVFSRSHTMKNSQ